MNKLFALIAVLSVTMPAIAAMPEGRGRASKSSQMESRAAVTKRSVDSTVVSEPTVVEEKAEDTAPEAEVKKDMREREKTACIQNNIGVGATFVWASRYSNTASYNSMVEDTEFPENNVCFVKVGLKSNDSRIDLSDIPTKYFIMGENIKCGQWADADNLKQRILDAKKKGRTWATVGGAVGGAAVGVGAMELFGNKLIGGAVEGQAALEGTELLCSQMGVLKKEKSSKYNDIVTGLKSLQKYCDDPEMWKDGQKPEDCAKFDYKTLLKC
jgi:hypothetical protein